MFKKPEGAWEIVPFAYSLRTDEAIDVLDRWSVEEFLRQYKSNYMVISHLREVLALTDPVSRFTDDEVVTLITAKLVSRDLMLRGRPFMHRAAAAGPSSAAAGNGGSSAKKKAAPAPVVSSTVVAPKSTPPKSTPPPTTRKPKDQQIVCELLNASIQCSHGRKPSKSGLLEVVPAESGDLISLMAQMKGGCGKHPEWSISGYRTSTEIGAKKTFRANVWRTVSGLWESEVIPHTYDVSVDACSGESRNWEVKAYPSDELSIQINAKTLLEAKERADWAVESVLGAYLKEPKFELLEGTGQVTASWQEHTDYRAFYKYDASIGFNPLIGCSFRIPFGPTAAVPEWLKKYGDAYFFVEFKGEISINAHWSRETPDKHEAFVDAKGSVEGAIGASMFFVNPKVTKIEAEGSTGVEAVCKADQEAAAPTLVTVVKWTGLKASVTIQGPWDIFEFKHEFKLCDEQEITTLKFNLITHRME